MSWKSLSGTVPIATIAGDVTTPSDTAAPVLDTVLADLTGLLGLQVGQADTRINALRCGKARLV